MVLKDEISENVGAFLKDGKSKLSNFYHLKKTHKIPTSVEKQFVEFLNTLMSGAFNIQG